jgi:hypothetical protein
MDAATMLLERNAAQQLGCNSAPGTRKPDSGHAGIVSTTVRCAGPAGTLWNPGSIASGSRPIVMIDLSCPGNTVLVMLM